MPIVVGIDEAGYGPQLGPLVVASSIWSVPKELVTHDWWEPLKDSVCRAADRDRARLVVDDSKQVYKPKGGLDRLERSVGAFLDLSHAPRQSVGSLLNHFGTAESTSLPWYAGCQDLSLPRVQAAAASDAVCSKLEETLASVGMAAPSFRAAVINETNYNESVARTSNKADVLIENVLALVEHASVERASHDSDGLLVVHVDRLGGRLRYREWLMNVFPGRELIIREETADRSAYEILSPSQRLLIEFVKNADQRHMAVALASMLAKYLRELVMEAFNRYWRQFDPNLKATAGYYTDSQRFLGDIAPLLQTARLRPDDFVRQR